MAKTKNSAALFSAILPFCLALPGCSPEAQPIEVTQVEPGFVRQGESKIEVTVRGRGFVEGAQVEFLVAGSDQPGEVTVHSVRVIDAETMLVTVSADSQAAPSAFDVRITFQDRVGKGTELFGIAPRSMGIRLLDGRLFDEFDNERDRLVAIIDQDLARQAWPGESAVGKQLVVDAVFGQMDLQNAEVIAVVQHVRSQQIRSPGLPQVYLPFRFLRSRSASMNIVLRASAGFESLAPQIRQMAAELGGERPVHGIRPLQQSVSDVTAATRSALVLLGALAIAALVLAAAGAYGVVSHSVAQRAHEIGIRMAVGARRSAILFMIFSQVAKGMLPALLLGLLSAAAFSRLMERWLFNVTATDPSILAAASLFLAAVTLLSCSLPAHRATRVDPLSALRSE